ncbi:MAG: toll/interleukin-1 receptor domain-containing protein [Isosphaeraceae bacterium]
MPGFVNSQKPDIFISYAHVDDQVFGDEQQGWVTRLADDLRKMLAMRLGRPENFDLWMDHQLDGNSAVTPLIDGKVADSAVFVLVLSPGYLGSIWTARELEGFRAEVARRTSSSGRIFLVEFDDLPRPEGLSDPRGYRFWKRDPNTKRLAQIGFPTLLPEDEGTYFRLVTELAVDVERELRRLKTTAAVPGPPVGIEADRPLPQPPPSTASTGPAVYLADVTEDLEDLRDLVKNDLIQAGHAILPSTIYPADPDAYEAAFRADIAKSSMFVQLLSELPGRKVREDGKRRVAIQLDLVASGRPDLPILQWRSRDLDWRRVNNPAHLDVLKGTAIEGRPLEVMAVDIEEFKATVKARLAKQNAPDPGLPPAQDCYLFINADSADLGLCAEVARYVEDNWPWLGYFPPRQTADPQEAQEYIEDNLKTCDGFIVIYGQADRDWVIAQLQRARQVSAFRDRRMLKVAIYEGPPEDNKANPIGRLPRMVKLDCRRGLNQAHLGQFLDSLRA